MFDIIKPKDHASYPQTINAFLDFLRISQGFDLTLEQKNRSSFIVPQTHPKDGYGGAVIYPQTVASSLEFDSDDRAEDIVIKLTSAFQPKGNEYWVARVFLYLDVGSSAAAILEAQDICHHFYQDIYKAFLDFGNQNGIDYLSYTVRTIETYSMKTYELWPYNLGIEVADPDFGFAQGILSLRGKRFKARPYPKEWRV